MSLLIYPMERGLLKKDSSRFGMARRKNLWGNKLGMPATVIIRMLTKWSSARAYSHWKSFWILVCHQTSGFEVCYPVALLGFEGQPLIRTLCVERMQLFSSLCKFFLEQRTWKDWDLLPDSGRGRKQLQCDCFWKAFPGSSSPLPSPHPPVSSAAVVLELLHLCLFLRLGGGRGVPCLTFYPQHLTQCLACALNVIKVFEYHLFGERWMSSEFAYVHYFL